MKSIFIAFLTLSFWILSPIVNAQEKPADFDGLLKDTVFKVSAGPLHAFTSSNNMEFLYFFQCLPKEHSITKNKKKPGFDEFKIRDCLKAVFSFRKLTSEQTFCAVRPVKLDTYDFKKKGFWVNLLPPDSIMSPPRPLAISALKEGVEFVGERVFVPMEPERASIMRQQAGDSVTLQYIVQIQGHTNPKRDTLNEDQAKELEAFALPSSMEIEAQESLLDVISEEKRKLTVAINALRVIAGAEEIWLWPSSLQNSSRTQRCVLDNRGDPILFDLKRHVKEYHQKKAPRK